MKRILAMWLLAVVPLAAQEINPAKSQKVDQSKVDAAIKKGVEYLKSKNADFLNTINHVDRQMSDAELVLLTYVTADVPVTDPAAKELFDDMMKRKLEATYCVSLQAMVLEEVDRVKHQHRIAQCAQFLVDNQSAQGFWGYGEPTQAVENLTPTTAPNPVATQPKGARVYEDSGVSMGKIKPKVKHRIAIKKSRDGTANDNSNSQYAALGLRAGFDAGISIPGDTVAMALKWWKENQKDKAEKGREAVSTGTVDLGPPRGWCYHYDNGHEDHKSFGSMTGGAVASMVIYHYMLGNDWWRDSSVKSGLSWLAANFSVTVNPGSPCTFGNNEKTQYHYGLYALERVGMLYGTVKIGAHAWYAEGAKELINAQKEDGSWEGSDGSNSTWDTCFAILFLKRATAPIATGDRR